MSGFLRPCFCASRAAKRRLFAFEDLYHTPVAPLAVRYWAADHRLAEFTRPDGRPQIHCWETSRTPQDAPQNTAWLERLVVPHSSTRLSPP